MKQPKAQYSLRDNIRWYWGVMNQAHPQLKWSLLGYVVMTAILGVIGVVLPAWLVGLLAASAHFGHFAGVALGMAAAVAGATAVNYYLRIYGNNFSGNVRSAVSLTMYAQVFGLAYQQLVDPDTQELYHRAAANGVSWTLAGAQAIFFGCQNLLADGVLLLLFMGTLSAFTPWLFALVLLAAAVAYWAMQHYRRWYAANKDAWSATARQQSYLRRTAYADTNGKDMRLYHTQTWYQTHFDQLIATRMAWQKRQSSRALVAGLIGNAAGLVRDGAAYGLLLLGMVSQTLTLSAFTLLFGVVNQFVGLTTKLLADWDQLTKASIDLQEVRAFLALKQPPAGVAAPAALAQRPVTIQFDHVSYTYPKSATASLTDVSFTLHAGERLALVGINGAGKSTLAQLMMGLFTPTTGRILINGVDAATLDAAARCALFAPVFQTSEVLALTVAQNVALTATPDLARVQQALTEAGLAAVVAALPQGLQTPMTRNIVDDGISFSGGQLQKLMLARALYKDAPVLVLDEPTAALAPLAENAIYTEYAALTAHKSAVFISHRLASTRFCDRILFLKDGRIAASGDHATLMAQGGDYATMYAVQSKYYQTEVTADEEA
ncbi:ATP-binding cassette domain-containing protein [Lacticaseibacillus daqingensis]|uniref:ATP-binding cassette domain-containing protein n=1 Tax=Lacticaseibacillus daqingensis TaxID=2486014 RepID=UPI000F7AF6F8|nr:ATP-binding cassette domain-containing protein [Lacticaseibacillus daqingensis]